MCLCSCALLLQLAQDTHTAFPPLGSCVDAVAVLSPSTFACGTQGGLLALFNSSCKKPLACVRVGQFAAPGKPPTPAETAEKLAAPLRATGAAMSVSALCALPMTDALLLGTEGGTVQVWSASQNDRKCYSQSCTILTMPSYLYVVCLIV